MKAIEATLQQSDPASVRKLMVFPELAQEPPHSVTQFRACILIGQSNSIAWYGVGETIGEAIDALEGELRGQAAELMAAAFHPVDVSAKGSDDG